MGLVPHVEDLRLISSVAHQGMTEAVGVGDRVAWLDNAVLSQDPKLFTHCALGADYC